MRVFVLQIHKALELRILWLLKNNFTLKGGARHQFINKAAFTSPHLTSPHLTCVISPQRGSVLNTRSNDFICTYIEHVTSHKWKNRFVSRYEG